MGKVVVKNKLSAYLNNLRKVEKNSADYFADKIANEGRIIAENYYGIDRDDDPENQPNINVSVNILGDGKSQVVASGKGLVYLEYGTGKLGESSNYQFKNPVPRTFHSNKLNRDVSLSEWAYNYAHNENSALPEVDGHRAFAQMFNTAQDLRQKYAKHIVEE